MPAVSLTGADTIQIDSRVLNDLADQDAVKLSYQNDLAAVKASKNGNMIYALNEMGKVAEAEVRVLLGSSDDKYLNSRLQEMKNDFSGFILVTASFSKRVGDGQGNMTTVVYQCIGGIFKKQIDAKTSTEGDTEQSVAVYTITFGNAGKSIQ